LLQIFYWTLDPGNWIEYWTGYKFWILDSGRKRNRRIKAEVAGGQK
jgi:hypothetical protein